MNGIGRIFWLPMILISFLGAWMAVNRAEKRIGADVDKMSRFEGFLRGYLIFANAPFVVMGLASILGGQTIFEVAFGTWANPYTILFDATLMVGWTALAVSVFYLDGAEMMQYMERNRLFGLTTPPTLIKVYTAISLIVFPIVIIAIRGGYLRMLS